MACQRCGATMPEEARACPTCGLAVSTAQSGNDEFAASHPPVAGYMPLYTTLPDGAPGNAPAFWVPFPLNVGTAEAPQYSTGIPRERLTTEPLSRLPDGTSPRHRAVAAPPKPHARRHIHWLALIFGALLAGLLVMAFALPVVVGGANSAAGLQLTGVVAYVLASVLAAIGLLANGFSRWNARRRQGYGPHAHAE